MKNTFKLSIYTLMLCLVVIAGCRGGGGPMPPDESRFFSGAVTEGDLCGYWIVTKESIDLLQNKGAYTDHLWRSDHIMVLRSNKMAVARCYLEYWTDPLIRHFERCGGIDLYNDHENEHTAWYQREKTNLSWYAWNPASAAVISGPYPWKHRGLVRDGELYKNKAARWQLDAPSADDEMPGYRVRFGVHHNYGFKTGRIRQTGKVLRYAGLYKGQPSLWAPLKSHREFMPDYDSLSHADMVIFVRVSLEELREIVRFEAEVKGLFDGEQATEPKSPGIPPDG